MIGISCIGSGFECMVFNWLSTFLFSNKTLWMHYNLSRSNISSILPALDYIQLINRVILLNFTIFIFSLWIQKYWEVFMRWIKLHSGYMLLQQLSAVRYTVIWCVVTGTHCMFSAICKTILHLTTLYWGRSQPLELLNSYSMLKFIVTQAKAISNSACYQYQMQTHFTCNVGVRPFT